MHPKIIGLTIATLLLVPLLAEARGATSDIPTIITRRGWGADESLGIVQDPEAELERTKNAIDKKGGTVLSERDKECQEMIRNYPDDFRVEQSVMEDEAGNPLVWSRRYSAAVKMFVIHHTGEEDGSLLDTLTGPEQVRSIYFTHAVKNGWGDVGYHYLIDRDGVIYEGRAGGKNIIGAHVYCANTGTLGIAMIGNFQRKEPTEEQLVSLRKLLHDLAGEYNVDLKGKTLYHGTSFPTVVSHRDLANTQCAGRTVQLLLPVVRRLAAASDYKTKLATSRAGAKGASAIRSLTPMGATALTLPPRGTAAVRLRFTAGVTPIHTGENLAALSRSDRMLSIFQNRSGTDVRTVNDLRADRAIQAGGEMIITLTILAPRQEGRYTFTVGGVTYTISVLRNR